MFVICLFVVNSIIIITIFSISPASPIPHLVVEAEAEEWQPGLSVGLRLAELGSLFPLGQLVFASFQLFWSTMHIETRRVRFTLMLFVNFLVNYIHCQLFWSTMYIEARRVRFTLTSDAFPQLFGQLCMLRLLMLPSPSFVCRQIFGRLF